MKYLVVGLGNIGDEYINTRHNVGFKILDALAGASNIVFDVNKRYGAIAEFKFKGRVFILLKPATYVNLSGNAVRYWMQKEKITLKKYSLLSTILPCPLAPFELEKKEATPDTMASKTLTIFWEPTTTPVFALVSGTSLIKANKSIMFWDNGTKKKKSSSPKESIKQLKSLNRLEPLE